MPAQQIEKKSKFSLLRDFFQPEQNKEVSQSDELIAHEFIWKHGGKEILLYGDWDNWNVGRPLKPRLCGEGHSVTIMLNPKKTWTFKFVVDGVWRCSLDLPTVKDPVGNVNNIITP